MPELNNREGAVEPGTSVYIFEKGTHTRIICQPDGRRVTTMINLEDGRFWVKEETPDGNLTLETHWVDGNVQESLYTKHGDKNTETKTGSYYPVILKALIYMFNPFEINTGTTSTAWEMYSPGELTPSQPQLRGCFGVVLGDLFLEVLANDGLVVEKGLIWGTLSGMPLMEYSIIHTNAYCSLTGPVESIKLNYALRYANGVIESIASHPGLQTFRGSMEAYGLELDGDHGDVINENPEQSK